jgi:hypothetical protein
MSSGRMLSKKIACSDEDESAGPASLPAGTEAGPTAYFFVSPGNHTTFNCG